MSNIRYSYFVRVSEVKPNEDGDYNTLEGVMVFSSPIVGMQEYNAMRAGIVDQMGLKHSDVTVEVLSFLHATREREDDVGIIVPGAPVPASRLDS